MEFGPANGCIRRDRIDEVVDLRFFFSSRRRHTRCLRDWSSDVCSSDLCRLRPFQATLVPERRQEITTEGGLALRPRDRKLADAIRRLAGAGIRVSLFIDPEPRTIERADRKSVV